MPHKQYFHKPTVIKDLILITVVNLLMFSFFLNYDVLEVIYHFSRQHEYFELDEIIPLGVTVALSLLVFSYRRISELGRMAQTLEHLSLIDPLTNLPNRRAGQIKLLSWCRNSQKSNKSFTILQIDIDDFKVVNDLYGEAVGDEVLILAAQIISKVYQNTHICIVGLMITLLSYFPLRLVPCRLKSLIKYKEVLMVK
jgi:predicted signal transduction protein with EAL and GGDEF domain